MSKHKTCQASVDASESAPDQFPPAPSNAPDSEPPGVSHGLGEQAIALHGRAVDLERRLGAMQQEVFVLRQELGALQRRLATQGI